MAPEILIFMPNGDVTLVLQRHVMKEVDSPILENDSSALGQTLMVEDEQQQEAGTEAEAPAEPAAEPEELEENVLYYAPDPPENLDGPLYPPPPRAARGSDASSRRDRSTSPPASFWASLRRQKAMIEASEDKQEQPVTITTMAPPMPRTKKEIIIVLSHEVHCVVSSRHMMLASQSFQTLLSGNSNEAIALRNQGQVTIPLAADLDTMVILLNIIHGASRKVPRQVSLEVLSKLAVLVRSFGMLETVEFFSDTWIDDFQRKGLPTSYNENVLPLLFIFWVFNRSSDFKDMTRLAQHECNEKLDEDVRDIPISPSIIDAIKRDRELALGAAITVIHELIQKYMVGESICDHAWDDQLRYACDAMVLGSLMKSSRKIGIWPQPETPFHGKNFKDLVHAIRSIRILDVCQQRRWTSHGPSPNCHGLEDSIEAAMVPIEVGLDGLELSDYPQKSEELESEFQKFLLTPEKDELEEQAKEDTQDNSPVYLKDEIVDEPPREEKVEIPEVVEFSTRIESEEVKEPAKKQEQQQEKGNVVLTEYSRDFQQPEARVSYRTSVQDVQESVQEETKAIPRYTPGQDDKKTNVAIIEHSRNFQQPEARVSYRAGVQEPVQEDMKAMPKYFPRQENNKTNIVVTEHPRDLQQPEARVSYRSSVQEPVQEEMKAIPRYSPSQENKVNVVVTEHPRGFQQPEARVFYRSSVQEPVQEEVKAIPRYDPSYEGKKTNMAVTEHPRNSQQPEAPASHRSSVQEVQEPAQEGTKAIPRHSPSQEDRKQPTKVIAKIIDEPTREEVKSAPREDVKVLGERKLNRTPSYPNIPRDGVRTTMKESQLAPLLDSDEEFLDKFSEKVSHPVKKDVGPSMVETKVVTPEVTPPPSATETEAMWTLSKNFKMRKSKKTFSTRF